MNSKFSPLLIVGVGASAGGLDALKRFFTTVPENAPIAFIVVQHLDPNHKSMMADILARQTLFSFCYKMSFWMLRCVFWILKLSFVKPVLMPQVFYLLIFVNIRFWVWNQFLMLKLCFFKPVLMPQALFFFFCKMCFWL